MTLKSIIDAELVKQGKTFKWLVGEVGISNDGLKSGLVNETIKLKDFKKLASVLNLSIETLLVSGSTQIQSQKGGKYNTIAHSSTLHEPATEYNTLEVEGLKKQVTLLESQIVDKDRIIELLSRK